VWIPPKLQHQLIVAFEEEEEDKGFWFDWIEQNCYTLFYIIKEFLINMICLDPALYETVCGVYHWKEFEQSCKVNMDIARSIMVTNFVHGEVDIFMQIDHEMKKLNTHQLKYLYQVPKQTFSGALASACGKVRQIRYQNAFKDHADELHKIHTQFKCSLEMEHIIRKISSYRHLLPEVSSRDWLECIGVSEAGLVCWGECVESQHRLFKLLSRLSVADFKLINHYVLKCYDVQSVSLSSLPKHWYEQQYLAMRHRNDTREIHPHAGEHFVCSACRNFKGFVVYPISSDLNFFAHGHKKIVYDDETGKYYCGKRAQRSNKTQHEPVQFFNQQTHRLVKKARTQRRHDEHLRCIDTELIPISLLGNMLQCYEKLFVLCPQPNCGKPCRFDFWKYNHSSFSCGRCYSSSSSSSSNTPGAEQACETIFCGYCRKKGDTSWRFTNVRIKGGGEENMYFCGKHDSFSLHQSKHSWDKDDLFRTIEQRQKKLYG
jgi:hypothetical protein